MTEEDFQYAHDQYYLTIVNDGAMYSKLQKLLRESRFTAYCGELDDFIGRLKVKHKLDEASMQDRVYIRLMTIYYLLTQSEAKQLFHSEPKLYNSHVSYCQTHNMMWLIDRLLRLPVVKPIKATPEAINGQPETQPAQENRMASIEIKNVTFINNTDVATMTDEQLIDAIKRVENEIVDLRGVITVSTKIKAKIAGLEETLAKVVAILDAR